RARRRSGARPADLTHAAQRARRTRSPPDRDGRGRLRRRTHHAKGRTRRNVTGPPEAVDGPALSRKLTQWWAGRSEGAAVFLPPNHVEKCETCFGDRNVAAPARPHPGSCPARSLS